MAKIAGMKHVDNGTTENPTRYRQAFGLTYVYVLCFLKYSVVLLCNHWVLR